MENQEQQHKRRVRYKGTHPRSYKEKYKELQPKSMQIPIEKLFKKAEHRHRNAHFICAGDFRFSATS